jgi:phosphopantetheine adenylyltransferase
MYGMINDAIREMALVELREGEWNSICASLDIPMKFGRMTTYDDAVTYQLVTAISETLGLPVDDLLKEFGKFWIQYAAKTHYGSLLKMFGSSFEECLNNLNFMHAHMGNSMPDLVPPTFVVQQETPETVLVHYTSKRPGLAPMVIGLLDGLAAYYGRTVNVTQIDEENAAEAQDTHKFLVNLL